MISRNYNTCAFSTCGTEEFVWKGEKNCDLENRDMSI